MARLRFIFFMIALFSLMVCTGSEGLLSFGCENEEPIAFDSYEATEITTTSARLNATCFRSREVPSVEACFVYAESMAGGPEARGWDESDSAIATEYQTVNRGQEFSAVIAGLTPGTKYDYVAVYSGQRPKMYGWVKENQNLDGSFTTASLVETLDADYPAVSTMATLRGNLPDLAGASSVEVYFLWGESPGVYTHETPRQTMTATGHFSSMIMGPFNIGSTYYFVARVGATGQGGEKSFTVQ